MDLRDAKPVRWIGSSRADLQAFPAGPRTNVGYAIWLAQLGDKASQAKPLKGVVRGAGVLEIVELRPITASVEVKNGQERKS